MKNKIYICLSTIPTRINDLKPVLESLINQTVTPNLIYINIPKKYNRFKNVKIKIPQFMNEGIIKNKVKIFNVDKDYGPGTKFIGSLFNKNIKDNDLIVITDDDIVKHNDWLEKLVNCYSENKICCFVEKNLGKQIIWGYLGYIFQKKLLNLNNLLEFYNNVKSECILIDDHWLTGYCAYKKIFIHNIPIRRNSEINKELLKGNDALVNIKGNEHRFIVSEKCRMKIKKEYNTEFPFWCCIGCCRRGRKKEIELFLEIDNHKPGNKKFIILLLGILFLFIVIYIKN